MLASCLASSTGWCSGSSRIPLPIFNFDVFAARRVIATIASRNGSVEGIVNHSGGWVGSTTCSPVHTDSNPAASAYCATATEMSGSAQVPKFIEYMPIFTATP